MSYLIQFRRSISCQACLHDNNKSQGKHWRKSHRLEYSQFLQWHAVCCTIKTGYTTLWLCMHRAEVLECLQWGFANQCYTYPLLTRTALFPSIRHMSSQLGNTDVQCRWEERRRGSTVHMLCYASAGDNYRKFKFAGIKLIIASPANCKLNGRENSHWIKTMY